MKFAWKRVLATAMTVVMVASMTPITAEAATNKGTVQSVTIKNLDTKTLVLKKGKTFKLKTKVSVKGKVSKKVTYSSSNDDVVTVSKSGRIKAIKKGTAKITVKSVANNKKKATIKVKVGTPVKKVKLNKKSVTANVGDTVKLTATLSPKKPTIKKLKFTSSKKAVATVDSKGVVTCVSKGSTKITVKAKDGSGKKATCWIKVKENPSATTENGTDTEATTASTENKTTENHEKDNGSTTQNKGENDNPKPETPTTPEITMGDDLSYVGYTLDWSDEFEGAELNRDDWNVELHEPGWVNAELQAYVDSEENIYVEDGKLVLNPVQTKNEDGSYSYTSGRVNTQNKKTYTYGMFEVKAKVPEGTGYLPAFWLMANDENVYGQWPRCGEIDIMEVHGSNTNKTYGTIHYGNPHKESQGTYSLEKGSFSEQYHTYTCEWEPGKITWYVDGYKFHEENEWYSATEGGGTLSYPAPFDQPFYIILNLAVGGSWVGYPDDETFEANPYMIDYVKVYQKDGGYDDSNVTAPEKDKVVIRDADANGNYLLNADFSEAEDLTDENGWQFKAANEGEGNTVISVGDNTIPAIDGKSAIVTTTNGGTVDYSIQLLQNNVPLIAGQTYELSFDAYASAARSMKVNSKAPNRSWYAYLDETVSLTTEKKTFTYEFDMIHADDANCTVEFNMGNFDSTDTIVIDNVSLRIKGGEVDEAAREEVNNPPKSARADGNYIYNGQFQEGDKRLGDWDIPEGVDASVTSLSDGRRLKVVIADDKPITISQKAVPVTAEGQFALSMDAELPEDGCVTVNFLGESYSVVPENGSYGAKFTTPAIMEDKTFAITFNGAGTYYIDNVRIDEDALIKNGSFNAAFSGFEPYVYAGDMASYGVDSLTYDNAAAFDINRTGDQAWYIQLKQNGVELEKGQWYRLSLDAKSTVDRKLMFAIQRDGSKHNDDWTPYSTEEKVDLTKDWNTFRTEFQMTQDTDLESVLSISMGAVGGVAVDEKHSIYIDNIMLEKIEEPEIEEVPEGENLFHDEALSEGFGNGWNAVFDANWSNPGVSDDPTKATGQATMVDNKAIFAIETLGEFDYSIQMKQENIVLEKDATYVAKFNIVSTKDRVIRAQSMDGGNAIMYGFSEAALTANETKTVTVDIDMKDKETDRTAYFQISLGKIGDTTPASEVTISNVSLVKMSGDSSQEEPEEIPEENPTVEVGVNQLAITSMADGSWGGEKAFTASEDAIEYVITNVGTEDSHIQLKQPGIILEKGAKYKVRFKATTTASRDIKIAFMHNPEENVWNWYGGAQKTLEQDMDNIVEYEFTVTGNTCKDIIFQVSMGQMFDETQNPKVAINTPASTITLSDFSLVKLETVE